MTQAALNKLLQQDYQHMTSTQLSLQELNTFENIKR